MKTYFQISLHALIIAAFFALSLTGRLDAPSIVIFIAGVSWSLYRTIRNLPPTLSARAGFGLSCIYIGVFFFDRAISRSFIPAAIHLVLFLELVKMHQEKTDKDYFYLIVLSFLKVLAASSLTIDMTFVATLVIFLVALVSTLMSFDMYRSERSSAAQNQPVAAPLGGMSVWATLWILVMGSVLFFLIPRVGTEYFSRAATPSLLMAGFSENVQLGQIGKVKLNSAVVMRVRQLSGKAYAALRLRGIALDAFDGKNWYKTNRRHARMVQNKSQFTLRPIDGTGDKVEYQVLLEPLATNALFAPHRLRSVRGPFAGIESDSDEGVYSRTPAFRRTQYEVVSEIPRRPTDNSASDTAFPESQRQYLQLPNGLDPRIVALAQEITGNAQTVTAKATAVEAYLKRSYRYTLELTWEPRDQPISTFLFDAKTGHCEYFASSMAILLRAAGIPTRLVNGFLMGEYNPVGNDFIIRQSDAHSWVEVFVPGTGWLEFDPTPPDPRERPNGLMAQFSHYADALELYWNSYILVYDSSTQFQLFKSAQDKAQAVQIDLREKSEWDPLESTCRHASLSIL